MSPRQLLLCYSSPYDDQILGQAAELCRASRSTLHVVLPVVDVAAADGCCGIQGEHWQRLMDDADRDAKLHAIERLEQLGCRQPHVDIELGRSVPEIAQRAAQRIGCDAIAVARRRWPWSSGLSQRQLTRLRAATTLDVLELAPRITARSS
jgi:hypothetical protein